MRALFAFALILIASTLIPGQAYARVFVGVGVGGGGYYPGGYYHPGYYYGPPPVVYAPPPVVYVSPPPPQVIYTTPAATAADQTSPTYTDPSGRTCRQFDTGGSAGKACLYSDGTWHVTP